MSLQSLIARVKLWDGTNQASVSASNALKVDGSAVTQPISAASLPSHAVTNAGTFATQAAQSGTWTVQPGNTANTTAWKVDGSAVTQPVSGTVTANVGTGNLAGITGVVHVDDNAGSLTVDGSVTAVPDKSATSTLSNVASSATSVTLLASNGSRKGATIYNDSTQTLYVKFGTTASATSFTLAMVAASYYEVPFQHTGRIDGIWASANGNARMTELT